MKEDWSELRLLEFQVTRVVRGSSILPREMTVISDFAYFNDSPQIQH